MPEYETDEIELSPEEADMVQQARNSGMSPRDLVRKAQENVRAGNNRVNQDQINVEAAKAGRAAAEATLRSREMVDLVRGTATGFKALELDGTDLDQIQATVSRAVITRPDYGKLTYQQTLDAIKEETTKECQRRERKNGVPDSARRTVESRLDKEEDAVAGSRSGGRSASSQTEEDSEDTDDFDGSLCGTGDDKAFAMTDAELNAQYSRKAQKFLKDARKTASAGAR